MISIHAPAKGATTSLLTIFYCKCYFNPRSREGSDNKTTTVIENIGISIHAPAKGATPGPGYHGTIRKDFNPRSREGSDSSFIDARSSHLGFQSTLPRRERQDTSSCLCNSTNFNPRSREGSDLCKLN